MAHISNTTSPPEQHRFFYCLCRQHCHRFFLFIMFMMLPNIVSSFPSLSSVTHRCHLFSSSLPPLSIQRQFASSSFLHRIQKQCHTCQRTQSQNRKISSTSNVFLNPQQAPSSSSPSSPNNLVQLTSLTHTYYALRHGQSLANVKKIISSDPQISTVQHGLSETGKQQAAKAGIQLTQPIYDPNKYRGIAIYASDFKRAKETAQIVAAAVEESSNHHEKIYMYKNAVQLDVALRERYFGLYNGKSDDHYHDVWKLDAISADHTNNQVESVNSVLNRTTKLILSLENHFSLYDDNKHGIDVDEGEDTEKPWLCVLVAHGDVLQILQTGFKKMDGTSHRSMDHLETADLRKLSLE